MKRIFLYAVSDIGRSRWLWIYSLFFLVLSFALFYFSNNGEKAVVSLLDVILIIVPLVSILFGVMYYYNTRDFEELLLAQPIHRRSIFLGQYLAICSVLSLCLIIGTSIPALYFGMENASWGSFFWLLSGGIVLNFAFVAIAFWAALMNENRIKGFGFTLLFWLFIAILYDGIFLLILNWFNDYPLQIPTIMLTLINPVDLVRILVLIHTQLTSLMGYNGAVFQLFFGDTTGAVVAQIMLMVCVIVPVLGFLYVAKRKNF